MARPLTAADPDALVREFVRPGDHVHLAGTPSRPNALTYALCRVLGRTGHLTVSTTAVHSCAHALALSGVADRVIAGFAGDTYPSPRPNPLYRELPAGRPFAFEAWSLLSYQQRLIAGAQGVPYAVTASLAGTDLAEDKGGDLHRVPDPADPERELTLLTALRPDLTLVHGVLADEDGNIALVPPLGEGAWAAYAARRGVLASVERIVPREVLRSAADRVVIPGPRVLGLCEAPFGAHPQSLRAGELGELAGVTGYLDDYAFLVEIVDACHGERRGADWYRTWVAEAGSHEGYLRRLGEARRSALSVSSASSATGRALESPGGGVPVPALPAPTAEPTRQERLIVLGARAVADRVREEGYDTLLAGIGSSHMAAWLAAAQLRTSGHPVTVVAELGMCGFAPAEGDVYLFSLRHAERSDMLAGIPEILGGMVAANPRALGVLAAAEIDPSGAINTSRTPGGHWLTGSGGANDIASTTDCVVIAPASRRRYVTALSYRTSPGDRVREVVSDFGRFRRDRPEAPFHLASWLPPAPGEDADPQRMVSESTCWTADASRAQAEKPVTPEELALLRTLDPTGIYR
jgi:acyl CoA:acetate/3-ketoacid CoA transferase alpha subunit/acyl CoA:acetate/3-ketoacid CoA transferase beta subunit